MTICINMGCGDTIARKIERDQWWFNLDRLSHDGVNVVADLENGLPFADGSVDVLYASHVMEHIKKFPDLMRECHRVLKPRGVLAIKVPMAGCRAAIADPTHVWHFAPETWCHFDIYGDIGFDTLGMRQLGFVCKWNEVVEWRRPPLDDGKPGAYFTEIIVDFEKDGPLYDWEEKLIEAQEAEDAKERAII